MNRIKKIPRRLLAQFAFFLLQNPLLSNFFDGRIYQGELKKICTPGLNCYSCPAAVMSCPIGALQLFFAGAKQSVSFFVAGFLLAVGAVFGRFICGYVCPMGLVQDLLYMIKTPKLIVRLRYVRYIKYVVLALFVIFLPLAVRHELSGLGSPWFCAYICPAGTVFGAVPLLAANDFLRGMAGLQFVVKASLAAGIVFVSVAVFRFFCRVLCPLGAIYSFFNKFAFFSMHCDGEKCVSCGMCSKACHIMLEPTKQPNSPECVRCGKCISACSVRALGVRGKAGDGSGR